jgi:hypothetical protein
MVFLLRFSVSFKTIAQALELHPVVMKLNHSVPGQAGINKDRRPMKSNIWTRQPRLLGGYF